MRGTARKIIAVLLFFLFMEKAGLRMFIHTHFHQTTSSASNSKNKLNGKFISQQDCGCLDDFFIPLTQVEETKLPTPTITYFYPIASYKYISIHTSPTYSSWLRGPPATA